MAAVVFSPVPATPMDTRLNAFALACRAKFDAINAFISRIMGMETSPEAYGAVGDGVTDDSAALQAALNTGKKVRLKPQTIYAHGTMLSVGDGTAATVSTKNGITLEGSTSAGAGSELAPPRLPTALRWIGPAGGTMMVVNGPMVGFNMNGVTFDCNNLANTGVRTNHMIASTWRDVTVTKYRGMAFVHEAYASVPGVFVQGANKNTFTNCRAKNPGAGGSGIRVGVTSGFTNGMLDVAQNVWINCEWYRDGASTTTSSVWLGFCDNLTFIECASWSQGGSSGVSVYVKPPTGTGNFARFPQEILFLNCPALGGFTVDAAWNPVSGITCYPYPTADGEALPSSPFISGTDFNGRLFGRFSVALRAAAAPVNNGDFVIEKTSDAALTFKVRGDDGIIRSAVVALT